MLCSLANLSAVAISSALVGRRQRPAGLLAALDHRAMEAGYWGDVGVRRVEVGSRAASALMFEGEIAERVVGDGWVRDPIVLLFVKWFVWGRVLVARRWYGEGE
jgi:hypothetical protein